MKIKAVVLEGVNNIALRDIEVPGTLEPAAGEVRVAIKAVGICGSDVHYFKHGPHRRLHRQRADGARP